MAQHPEAFDFRARARFADNLYRARERVGLSQKDAAERAALTRARLDTMESGEVIPGLDVLTRLAGAYSTPVRKLVDGIDWRPSRVPNSEAETYESRSCSVFAFGERVNQPYLLHAH